MSNSTFAIVFGNLCPSIILTQGVGFYVLDGACKVFIHSGYVYFHSACDFAKRVPFKVQAEDTAGTAVIMFTGLGMTVIMVEELAQAVFVFGAVLCVVVIEVAIDDFDILAVVDDFEGSELYIAEMDTNDFSLTDTLDEGVIFIEESLPEVLYRDVL